MFCKECGSQINNKAIICISCGCSTKAIEKTSEAPPKYVLAVVAIFLGSLGIHQFMAGRVIAGIFSLLFCWTCLPAIVGLLQGINLLISDTYYKNFIKPLNK